MADSMITTALLDQANIVGIRAVCGMLGASVLIMALPPRSDRGHLDFSLLLQRVLAGAYLPVFVGPWGLAVLKSRMENLMLHEYPELIFFLLGMISYFLFRWVAIWLDKNKDKSITDMKFNRRWDDKSETPAPDKDA